MNRDMNDLKKAAAQRWEVRQYTKLMEEFNWNMTHAAKAINMDRANFLRKVRALKIVKPVKP